ncbi:hypothetical protein R6Q57_007746 [Mikania cordata]
MAPTKRKSDGKPGTTHKTTRVTRSSTRQTTKVITKVTTTVMVEPTPKSKKAKVTTKNKPKSKPKAGNGSKTIVIEHCKQCNEFKVRAHKVKLDLENAVPGIAVFINPEQPRRGCFEVREEDGKKFMSLLNMKPPFAPMKALDMDAVISDIIDQIR